MHSIEVRFKCPHNGCRVNYSRMSFKKYLVDNETKLTCKICGAKFSEEETNMIHGKLFFKSLK